MHTCQQACRAGSTAKLADGETARGWDSWSHFIRTKRHCGRCSRRSMGRESLTRSACWLLVACCSAAACVGDQGSRRSLQQATVIGATSVRSPDGTRNLFSLHGVGTQKYRAATNGSYIHMGTTADLFENTDRKGTHYAEESGVPVWEVLDSSGAVAGSVKGRALTKVAREGSPMDGGFGSVDSVLYVTYDAEGWLGEVTYIEMQNPLGGVVPTGLHALPAHADKVDNHKLAIPYQADYNFLSGGLPYGEGGKERAPAFEVHLHHPMTKESLRHRRAMADSRHGPP